MSENVQTDLAVADFEFDLSGLAPLAADNAVWSLPEVKLIQDMSSDLRQAGGKPGQWAVVSQDGTAPPRFYDTLNVAVIDVLSGRVMFAFLEDGSRDEDITSPVCGSNDGITPRVNYIGSKFKDPRNGLEVEIVENGCAKCQLGSWAVPAVDPATGLVLTDESGKVVYKQFQKIKQQIPPCSLSGTAVLFVFTEDGGFPALWRSKSPSIRRFILGVKMGKSKTPALASYYTPPTKCVNPKTKRPHPLTFSMETFNHESRGSMTYVPKIFFDFEQGSPLTKIQYDAWQAAHRMYVEQGIRSVLQSSANIDVVPDDGFDKHMSGVLSPDRAKELLSGRGSDMPPTVEPAEGDDPF